MREKKECKVNEKVNKKPDLNCNDYVPYGPATGKSQPDHAEEDCNINSGSNVTPKNDCGHYIDKGPGVQ